MSTNLHERLAEARTRAGLSQRKLTELLNARGWDVSNSSVSNYERGDRDKIPAKYLHAICEELDVSPEWLLTGKGDVRWARGDRRAQARGAVLDWLEHQVREMAEPYGTYNPDAYHERPEGHRENGDEGEAATR